MMKDTTNIQISVMVHPDSLFIYAGMECGFPSTRWAIQLQLYCVEVGDVYLPIVIIVVLSNP